jgi:hypothetical protein
VDGADENGGPVTETGTYGSAGNTIIPSSDHFKQQLHHERGVSIYINGSLVER